MPYLTFLTKLGPRVSFVLAETRILTPMKKCEINFTMKTHAVASFCVGNSMENAKLSEMGGWSCECMPCPPSPTLSIITDAARGQTLVAPPRSLW